MMDTSVYIDAILLQILLHLLVDLWYLCSTGTETYFYRYMTMCIFNSGTS
jgi:hypothetical protein